MTVDAAARSFSLAGINEPSSQPAPRAMTPDPASGASIGETFAAGIRSKIGSVTWPLLTSLWGSSNAVYLATQARAPELLIGASAALVVQTSRATLTTSRALRSYVRTTRPMAVPLDGYQRAPAGTPTSPRTGT